MFISDRGSVDNVWAMNPDGTGQRQLSSELSPITMYAVAPDGRSLIVGDGARLVMQEADGGGRQTLTPDGVLEIDPAFSPDGSQIAFGRVDPVTGSGLGLWTKSAAGGDANPVVLPNELLPSTPTPALTGVVAEPAPILRAPRYSPDSAALAYVDMSGRVGVLELPQRSAHHRAFRGGQPAGVASRFDRRAALRLAQRVVGPARSRASRSRPWIPVTWTSPRLRWAR